MRAIDVIEQKRDGYEHKPETIEWFIKNALNGTVENYQVSAWLMAVYLNGMTPKETAALALTMIRSGRVSDMNALFPDRKKVGRIVDKHSTGGVGDKVSIILAPLVAAMGMTNPMVSGRGLAHTGGTLDKLESIPGFKVHLDEAQSLKQLAELGNVMLGQSDDFVPADKLLYALRDVTATVPSIPLITASILSKKAAAGVEALVMDVKVGSGAFANNLDKARQLALSLKNTAQSLNMDVRVLITDMNQPLGKMVGNSLEVVECIKVLHGAGPADLRQLTLEEAAEMLMMSKIPSTPATYDEALEMATTALDNGSAWSRFIRIVKAQGGDVSALEDPFERLDIAPNETYYLAPKAGWIQTMDCKAIGNAACCLGAGRLKASDSVDPGVGMEMLVRIGDMVAHKQPLVHIIHRNNKGLSACLDLLKRSFLISDEVPRELPQLIYERI